MYCCAASAAPALAPGVPCSVQLPYGPPPSRNDSNGKRRGLRPGSFPMTSLVPSPTTHAFSFTGRTPLSAGTATSEGFGRRYQTARYHRHKTKITEQPTSLFVKGLADLRRD